MTKHLASKYLTKKQTEQARREIESFIPKDMGDWEVKLFDFTNGDDLGADSVGYCFVIRDGDEFIFHWTPYAFSPGISRILERVRQRPIKPTGGGEGN